MDLNQHQSYRPPMARLPGTNSHLIHEPLAEFQKLKTCSGKLYTKYVMMTLLVQQRYYSLLKCMNDIQIRTWENSRPRPNGSRKGPRPRPRPLSRVKSALESFVPSLYYTTEFLCTKLQTTNSFEPKLTKKQLINNQDHELKCIKLSHLYIVCTVSGWISFL